MMGPIGIFDSGYGGLTVMRSIVDLLPQYDYCYLGDNARAPYGNRSYDTVYQYTLESVKWLFSQGCPLVILACNTASAKALRPIQQQDLEQLGDEKRVLGVIRPTSEVMGHYSKSGKLGILATKGTVQSNSYPIELNKFSPGLEVFQHFCPMWVPLIETGEYNQPGADYFIEKDIRQLLQQNTAIDTILLACTHYPLLIDKIGQVLPQHIQLITQGSIVAESLKDYLSRHPEMDARLSKNSKRAFFTTDASNDFDEQASNFFGEEIHSQHVTTHELCFAK